MHINIMRMHLSEDQQAVLAVAVVLLIGIIGLGLTGGIPGISGNVIGNILSGDVYVDQYNADIYLNGTIKENFVYQVNSNKYRMLYRNWVLPLSTQKLNRSYVELLNINQPFGTVAYMKESSGSVNIISKDADSSKNNGVIQSLALPSEAGCFKPDYFSPGKYQISYAFKIHPPLENDDQYWHWNLLISNEHLPYRQATITIHDPDNLIVQLFPHMLMDAKKVDDSWVMTGNSPKDSRLEVEMIMKPGVSKIISGFPTFTSNTYERTLSAQGSVSNMETLKVLRYLVILFPLALALYYYRFGREKRFVVPNVLSYVPNKRKPWLVNYVFKGDAYDFDKNGFYATLLDLYERKIINIDNKTGTRIMILKEDEAGEDDYEKAVLRFLKENAYKGVFNVTAFKGQIDIWGKSGKDYAKLQDLHNTMSNLFKYKDDKIPNQFVSGKSLRTLGIPGIGSIGSISTVSLRFCRVAIQVAIILFVFGASIGGFLARPIPATITILIVQLMVPAFAPSALFGRWKGDYYKEKLEWDAFKNFLSDFAMIKKYTPEDISIWKDWLIYGTALGVGDKVEKAMDEMNIHIPIAIAASGIGSMHTHFDHAYSSSAPRSSGSGGGSGFGGGGGSGGGGGGAR